MNASELADDLDYASTISEPRIQMMGRMRIAATMLRQQQAEIEALKQIIDANNLNQNIGQFVKPANEPVAWVIGTCPDDYRNVTQVLKEAEEELEHYKQFGPKWQPNDKIVPLYTHPVKDREKDRLRFSDEAFNRWLDESISDSGHTVYNLVENVCEAWHGWENSQYYTHSVKEEHFEDEPQAEELHEIMQSNAELTDEEILIVWVSSNFMRYTENGHIDEIFFNKFARAILRKAQEK